MADVQQILASSLVNAVVHPLSYAKVLMQIGYEPVAAEPCKTIFGKPALCYPNVLRYLGHLKKQEGFLSLYRGLGASITSHVAGSTVSALVSQYIDTVNGDKRKKEHTELVEGDSKDQLIALCVRTGKESLVRCAGVIASHPLKVIMIRSMVQVVGGETKYDSLFSSLSEIYHEDGILGFFSGLVPRLIGELLALWITSFLAEGVVTMSRGSPLQNENVKNYSNPLCSIVVSQFTYPFNLVWVVQAANTRGLVAGSPPSVPLFPGWTSCWSYLRAKNALKRGSSMFFRYYNGPVILVNGKPTAASSAF